MACPNIYNLRRIFAGQSEFAQSGQYHEPGIASCQSDHATLHLNLVSDCRCERIDLGELGGRQTGKQINDFVNQFVQLDSGSVDRADIKEKCNQDWPDNGQGLISEDFHSSICDCCCRNMVCAREIGSVKGSIRIMLVPITFRRLPIRRERVNRCRWRRYQW